jgi:hypothetical protein
MSTFNELIDFTRSTTGTYLDSVVYGDELVTNGDFSNGGANWSVTNTDATHYVVFENNSARFVTGTTTPVTGLLSDVVLEANETYKLEVNISSITSGSIKIDGSNVSQIFDSVGTTVAIVKPVIGNGVIKFYRATDNVDLVIDSVSVKKVIGGQVSGTPLLRTAAINEPRLEYDASGNPLGLLIEEARTNLLKYSEGFTTGWGTFNIVTTPNIIASPDGAVSGARLQEDSSGTGGPRRFPNDTAVLTANQAQTLSCFFKAGTSAYAYLTIRYSNGNVAAVEFDLTSGTVNSTAVFGNMTLNSSDITSAGNGWYRCSVTATSSASTANGRYFLAMTDGSGLESTGYPNYALTGKNIYAWGAQAETGSFPTSYIPTSGSAVTRTKDLASLPVERFAYNQPQGTVVAFQETFGTAGNLVPWEIHTANTNRILYNAKSSIATIITGGSVQASLNHADQLPSVFYKQGLAFKKDDIASSLDASTLTDTSGTIPTVSSFKIGTDRLLVAMLNGHIKQIQYYPKRLSNEELELLTQPSASPTMNLTFDGQATSTLVEGLHD